MNATGRPDFDQMVKIASVPSDEPVFLLRARDIAAAPAVRAWAALAMEAGAPVSVIEQALQQADRMEAWAVKKVPDEDHIEPTERKRLAHQLRRRLWDGGKGPAATHPLAVIFEQLLKRLQEQAAHPLVVADPKDWPHRTPVSSGAEILATLRRLSDA